MELERENQPPLLLLLPLLLELLLPILQPLLLLQLLLLLLLYENVNPSGRVWRTWSTPNGGRALSERVSYVG